jgi:hypothetical protein
VSLRAHLQQSWDGDDDLSTCEISSVVVYSRRYDRCGRLRLPVRGFAFPYRYASVAVLNSHHFHRLAPNPLRPHRRLLFAHQKGPLHQTQLHYEGWVATMLERGPEPNSCLELGALLELDPRPAQTVGPLLEPGLASPETMLAAEPTDA